MTGVSRVFDRALSEVFDLVLHPPAATGSAIAGPVRLHLAFASSVLADSYLSSFRRNLDGPGGADLLLGVVTVSDIDLVYAIPQPLDQGRTYIDSRHFVVWHTDRHPVLYVLDRTRRRGLVWLASGTAPEWELSRPACPLIHAMTMDTSWAAVHGGAVGRGGRVLMLAGKGRAGKSTAALACVRAGWSYAGDDYVIADTATGQIEPLYVSARLRSDMGAAFADMLHMRHGVSDDGGDIRHELRLLPHASQGAIRGGSLAAILLPRRLGSPVPNFTPARRADAFNALFMQTRLGMPGPLKGIAEKLTTLVGLAPAFFVDTGTAPDAIPGAFDAFLNDLKC
jgi:hypothetical protein